MTRAKEHPFTLDGYAHAHEVGRLTCVFTRGGASRCTTPRERRQERCVAMWRLDLICCGREDGHFVRETWAEADSLRQDYERTEGHDRQAILVEDFAHDGPCNGYSDGCPFPGGSFRVAS